MIIKLPRAISFQGSLIDTLESKAINAGTLADTSKVMDTGNAYKAFITFLTGCIEKAGDITDPMTIKAIMAEMPYKSAEYAMIKLIMQEGENDAIQAIYTCPFCGSKKDCTADMADHLADLDCIVSNDTDTALKFTLDQPVTTEDDNELLKTVMSIGLAYPTLNHCVKAAEKQGFKDTARLQFAIYIESMTKINGQPIDNKFKTRWGQSIFNKLTYKELIRLGDQVNNYGLVNQLVKQCLVCGKEFKTAVNTSSFFVSILQ